MKPRELRRLYAWTLALTVLGSLAISVVASHVVYNATRSLPFGFYWMTGAHEIRRGDIIAFNMPPNVRALVHDRSYLPDKALLLKPVVAIAGDDVCTSDGVLRVNQLEVGQVLSNDSAGRPLPHQTWCG